MSSAVANELERLQEFLQDRVAEIVGTNASAISPNAALSSLGVDSLGLLHLIESVESELRIDVPHNVCLDRLTIQTLARSLAETGPSRPAGPAVAIDALSQITADCHLPDDIRPAAVECPAVPRAILLTGATGFLGAFLVRSLLQKTEARLVCLVRPQSGDAETRLRQNLEQYRIWEDGFEHRITVLEADIAQPRLGLSPSAFDRLADEVDVILHAAASVNWIQPYARR